MYAVHDDGDYIVRYRVYPDRPPISATKPAADGNKSKDNPSGDGASKDRIEKSQDVKPASESKPPEIAILVDKHELKTFDVTDGERRKPQVVEIKTHLPPGEHRFELLLRRGWEDDSGRPLRVINLELVGPPDTRTPSEPHAPAMRRKAFRGEARSNPADSSSRLLRLAAIVARPPTPSRIASLNLPRRLNPQGQPWKDSISLAMQAMLISPKFLFRVELDDRPDSPGPHAIDEYQLASRLSYFIWSTMPDDELLDLAGKNQLTANLDQQVRRMLKDPRANALVDNFAMQWLQLRRLKKFRAPDTGLFSEF